MSLTLRTRLMVGPTIIVLAAIAVALVLLVQQARQRIGDERESSVQLARHLVETAIKSRWDGDAHPALSLRRDLDQLPQLRHVRLFVLPLDQGELLDFRDQVQQAKRGWLWMLLRPDVSETVLPISVYDAEKGHVVMVADPADELAEIGTEFNVVLALLLGLTAMFVALVGWSVAQALRPLRQVQAGLGQLQQGDFSANLPPLTQPELAGIGHSFNALAAMLRHSRADNELLIGKLLSLQESERRDLARDLHDELGPCLFGIRFEAASMGRVGTDLTAGEIATHTGNIVKLVEDLQKMNRRILARLRPVALAELGILAALERLVEDWRSRCPDIDWSFHCAHFTAEPAADLGLVLYRVVQECLTNAARHSGAKSVSVELECGAETRLLILDDGCGIAADITHGFGLLGMRERVQAVGGRLNVADNPEGGTMIDVRI